MVNTALFLASSSSQHLRSVTCAVCDGVPADRYADCLLAAARHPAGITAPTATSTSASKPTSASTDRGWAGLTGR